MQKELKVRFPNGKISTITVYRTHYESDCGGISAKGFKTLGEAERDAIREVEASDGHLMPNLYDQLLELGEHPFTDQYPCQFEGECLANALGRFTTNPNVIIHLLIAFLNDCKKDREACQAIVDFLDKQDLPLDCDW